MTGCNSVKGEMRNSMDRSMFTEGTSMRKENNKELALALLMMELSYGVNGIEGKLMESQRRRHLMAIFIGVNARKI